MDRLQELNKALKEKDKQIITLSGPSGSGKTSIEAALIKNNSNKLFRSISMTTRKIRGGEHKNKDYIYLDKQEFKNNIEKNNFLEWAFVYDTTYYGTPILPLIEQVKQGKSILLSINIDGAKIIKNKVKNLKTIFITTEDLEDLKERLVKRNTDNKDAIKNRLAHALKELDKKDFFDKCFKNKKNELDSTVQQIEDYLKSINAI